MAALSDPANVSPADACEDIDNPTPTRDARAADGGVPLREALALPALRNARVLAGAAGLGHAVRYVNVMEVPDIIDWVKPDELLLTTAYPLRDDRAGLADLVPRLAERGLAGLAVKPARYLDAVPQVMLDRRRSARLSAARATG